MKKIGLLISFCDRLSNKMCEPWSCFGTKRTEVFVSALQLWSNLDRAKSCFSWNPKMNIFGPFCISWPFTSNWFFGKLDIFIFIVEVFIESWLLSKDNFDLRNEHFDGEKETILRACNCFCSLNEHNVSNTYQLGVDWHVH